MNSAQYITLNVQCSIEKLFAKKKSRLENQSGFFVSDILLLNLCL